MPKQYGPTMRSFGNWSGFGGQLTLNQQLFGTLIVDFYLITCIPLKEN